MAEVCELAGNCAADHKSKRIKPRDIMLGMRLDDELAILTKDVVFPKSGSIVNIHPALQKSKKKKKKKTKGFREGSQTL